MRIWGGLLAMRRRSAGVVSPVRMAVVGAAMSRPAAAASSAMAERGRRRFRSTAAASAFMGETYRIRTPGSAGEGGLATRRSTAARNAASVLPEPVGAMASTFSPSWMASQASACTGVGASNSERNHDRTAAVKRPMGAGDPSGVRWAMAVNHFSKSTTDTVQGELMTVYGIKGHILSFDE